MTFGMFLLITLIAVVLCVGFYYLKHMYIYLDVCHHMVLDFIAVWNTMGYALMLVYAINPQTIFTTLITLIPFVVFGFILTFVFEIIGVLLSALTLWIVKGEDNFKRINEKHNEFLKNSQWI